MILNNLVKNSISAFYAAIEIHNKPRISYRYETTTLLIFNSWELILKAYVRKYTKESIFTKDDKDKTIGADKALEYTYSSMNQSNRIWFKPIRENILLIEKYRNNCTHYYNSELNLAIFSLLAKSCLNYVEFLKKFFDKEILDKNLYILPLGFKLPFSPIDFLAPSVREKMSDESKKFLNLIVNTIKDLNESNVDGSIVVGFDVLLNSIKNVDNYDVLAAIDTDSDLKITIEKKVYLSDGKGTQKIEVDDTKLLKMYPLSYKILTERCKAELPGLKLNYIFNDCVSEIKKQREYSYERRLDPLSSKTPKKYLYSEKSVKKIIELYLSKQEKI